MSEGVPLEHHGIR